MIVDPSRYCEFEKIQIATDLMRSCVSENDLAVLQPFWYGIAEEEEGIDFDGVDIKHNPNIKMYGIDLFQSTGIIREKFLPAIEFVKTMDGIEKFSVNLIGPHSIVPHHVDDQDRPINSESIDYNLFTGLYVPSEDVNVVGVQIGTEKINHGVGRAVVFDRQTPHKAWNKSNSWWIAMILYIKKNKFK